MDDEYTLKDWLDDLRFRYLTRPLHKVLCKLGKHSDFVYADTQAHCIFCPRVTDVLPKWYLKATGR